MWSLVYYTLEGVIVRPNLPDPQITWKGTMLQKKAQQNVLVWISTPKQNLTTTKKLRIFSLRASLNFESFCCLFLFYSSPLWIFLNKIYPVHFLAHSQEMAPF